MCLWQSCKSRGLCVCKWINSYILSFAMWCVCVEFFPTCIYRRLTGLFIIELSLQQFYDVYIF